MRVTPKPFLLLPVAGVLLACTTPGGANPAGTTDGSPEPPIEVRQVTTYGDLSFPLDAYDVSSTENEGVLDEALATAAQRCFERVGAPSVDLSSLLRTGPKRDGLKLDLLTLTDEAAAADRGLHGPAQLTEQAPPELPAEVEFALHGEEFGTVPAPAADWAARVPSYGCYGNALRVLDGDDLLLERVHLGNDLVGQSWQLAREHSEVRSTFDAWAACMQERGYDYQAPDELYADPQFSPRGSGAGVVTAEERAAAVDLVRCGEVTGLVGVLAGAVAAYQEVLLQRHAEELVRFQDDLNELQRRAVSAKILDEVTGRLGRR